MRVDAKSRGHARRMNSDGFPFFYDLLAVFEHVLVGFLLVLALVHRINGVTLVTLSDWVWRVSLDHTVKWIVFALWSLLDDHGQHVAFVTAIVVDELLRHI